MRQARLHHAQTTLTIFYNDNEEPIYVFTAKGAYIQRYEETAYLSNRRIRLICGLSIIIADFAGNPSRSRG